VLTLYGSKIVSWYSFAIVGSFVFEDEMYYWLLIKTTRKESFERRMLEL